jgi:type VI secretion system protein
MASPAPLNLDAARHFHHPEAGFNLLKMRACRNGLTMRERTLSERLMMAGTTPPVASGRLDRATLGDSILRNLQELLNSRAGCCEIREDYGMPDFDDIASRFPDAVPAVARAIKMQIENFEPRLSGVNVRHLPDPSNPLSLSFLIGVTLSLDDGAERLSFQTGLGDDGKLRVRS